MKNKLGTKKIREILENLPKGHQVWGIHYGEKFSINSCNALNSGHMLNMASNFHRSCLASDLMAWVKIDGLGIENEKVFLRLFSPADQKQKILGKAEISQIKEENGEIHIIAG